MTAPLDARDGGAEQALCRVDREPFVLRADFARAEEARAVERAGCAADVFKDGGADGMQDGFRIFRMLERVERLEHSLEAACHVDAVVAVADLRVEIREIVFFAQDHLRDSLDGFREFRHDLQSPI